ncbi:MAG: phosphomannomutase [Pseudomonadota bacterium]
MPPKFGTSGLRGLVVELTPALVADHVRAFLAACPVGTGLWVGRDLRPSSPAIAGMVMQAAQDAGVRVIDAGDVPTPALALAAMKAGAAAVMVTGSHIPADRNGLKFYTPTGEISKADEQAILAALGSKSARLSAARHVDKATGLAYVDRYVSAFGGDALRGMTVGVYTHSTVGRDLLMQILKGLGAGVVELGRSETFIPVDTEAVSEAMQADLTGWAAAHDLDAIVSLDGDGDRPLLTDATGRVVPGDVLGQITGAALGAAVAVTPVSSNTGAEGVFQRVDRTRIGSPFVIAGMEDAGGDVVGYEANGGFLLGFAATGPAGTLPPLMTRDAVLPLVVPLMQAKGQGVAALVAGQPARFTATGRIENVPTEVSLAYVAKLDTDSEARTAFLAQIDGVEVAVDRTDGLRMTLTDGRIAHLRPSGNAPECRFYAEADSAAAAQAALAQGLTVLEAALRAEP